MNTLQLEQKLLEQELKVFKKNVAEGLDLITKAFEKYINTSTNGGREACSEEEALEISEYIKSIPLARSYYGGQYFAVNREIALINKLPSALEKVILRYAVAQFLEKIEQASSVVDNLEH